MNKGFKLIFFSVLLLLIIPFLNTNCVYASKVTKEYHYQVYPGQKLKVQVPAGKNLKWNCSDCDVKISKKGTVKVPKVGVEYEEYTITAKTNKHIYRYYLTVYPKAVLKKVENVSKKIIKPGMSDVQKVKAVHDWLCLNCVYDWKTYEAKKKKDICEDSFFEVGALLYGKAVCAGYTEAFDLFMRHLNIPSSRISGTTVGGFHAWNQVKIDGKWYNVDVTWDDRDNKEHEIKYNYFLGSDYVFSDHKPACKPHKCKNSYPNLIELCYPGEVYFDNVQAVQNYCIEQFRKGNTDFFVGLKKKNESEGIDYQVIRDAIVKKGYQSSGNDIQFKCNKINKENVVYHVWKGSYYLYNND